jgi:hypothetical protein
MRAFPSRFHVRSSGLVGVAVAVLVLFTAGPASAVSPGSYTIASTTGAAFTQLSSGNLVSGIADDVLYPLSTTGTGLHRLPFALHLYNQSYTNAVVSSNGNIQPGVTSGNSTFSNDCLPTSAFLGRPSVLPFWDDLYFDSNDTSHGFTEGVFVRTSGSAPHRKFLVSWQGHLFGDTGSLVMAQVTFTEGSQNLTYVYGRNGGGSATVGIQSKQQLSWTQRTCNAGGTPLVSGQKLTLTHH